MNQELDIILEQEQAGCEISELSKTKQYYCSKCGTEISPRKFKRSGMCDKCLTQRNNRKYRESHKEQLAEYRRNYYEEHKEELNQKSREYSRTHIDTIRESKRKYRTLKSEEVTYKSYEYREKHKDHLKKQKKEYYQTKLGKQALIRHREKQKMDKQNMIVVEKVDLHELYNRYNGICQNCGVTCDWEDKTLITRIDGIQQTVTGPTYPTQDHIIPVSKGGEESYKNSQLLCKSCNSRKKRYINKGEKQNNDNT